MGFAPLIEYVRVRSVAGIPSTTPDGRARMAEDGNPIMAQRGELLCCRTWKHAQLMIDQKMVLIHVTRGESGGIGGSVSLALWGQSEEDCGDSEGTREGAEMITPIRNVRVPEAVWQAAKDRAERDETTVSAVVVAALIAYGTPAPVPRTRKTEK